MTPEEHDHQVDQEDAKRENDAMINYEEMDNKLKVQKSAIRQYLFGTKRKGIQSLIDYLDESDFYTIPASKQYHNTEKGGLAKHCISVYKTFSNMLIHLKINTVPHDSIIICSLLHDLCKITPKSRKHAKMSIFRILDFIELTPLELTIIKFHMGYYYTTEFTNNRFGEYTLAELTTAQNNPIVKLFHWCDDMDAQFISVNK